MLTFPAQLSETVAAIYSHLKQQLQESCHISPYKKITTNNSTYGDIEMQIEKINHPHYQRGRLCSFKLNQQQIGMMFFMLPKAENALPIFGTDIMSSPYALSLLVLDTSFAFKKNKLSKQFDDQLQKTAKRLLTIAKRRKTPAVFQPYFSDEHIIVGVKKQQETSAPNIVNAYHDWVCLQLSNKPLQLNSSDTEENFNFCKGWIQAMRKNIKEENYWEKVFGKQTTHDILNYYLFKELTSHH